ncbi:hypothetical protein BRADI_3g09401v3 [Brachypodium distachyon]|uniref:Secreted protein n=1 Tax=Brachypodium distachyon TaxID=15368 RepID=A0A2K2CW63_BRADI|nr:hypothetical protein BRADI_3g09401v3 [Brachypodium distachyon]
MFMEWGDIPSRFCLAMLASIFFLCDALRLDTLGNNTRRLVGARIHSATDQAGGDCVTDTDSAMVCPSRTSKALLSCMSEIASSVVVTR